MKYQVCDVIDQLNGNIYTFKTTNGDTYVGQLTALFRTVSGGKVSDDIQLQIIGTSVYNIPLVDVVSIFSGSPKPAIREWVQTNARLSSSILDGYHVFALVCEVANIKITDTSIRAAKVNAYPDLNLGEECLTWAIDSIQKWVKNYKTHSDHIPWRT